MVKTIIDKIKDKNILVLYFVFLTIDLSYTFGISYLINQINPDLLAMDIEASLATIFFVTVIFGPLIETLIFQVLIIEILLHFFKKQYNLVVLISGGLFALTHYYNAIYILIIVVPGILYALYYLIFKDKTKSKMAAFGAIFLLHALVNLAAFLYDNF